MVLDASLDLQRGYVPLCQQVCRTERDVAVPLAHVKCIMISPDVQYAALWQPRLLCDDVQSLPVLLQSGRQFVSDASRHLASSSGKC